MRGRAAIGRWGALALLATLVATPTEVQGQVQWRDLVLTMAGSVEDYDGNLSAVTVPLVDSTDNATAAVGELALRGTLALLQSARRDLELSFDGGMRQAAAMGFTSRDYAPRELVGSGSLQYTEGLGTWARLVARVGYRGRSVRDRPPMPLFLQPGYATGTGSVALVTRAMDGVSVDLSVDGELADYRALEFLPQLDLLDRRAVGATAGARWGTASTLRVFGGVRWSEYPHQGSFVPEDPFRRDRRVNVGMEWTYAGAGAVFAQVGLEGTLNRSNSNRPEYDALSVQGLFNAPLPWRMSLNVRAVITGKSYVQETDFARLVPGEEADNASLAYLQFTRPLASNLDGAIRFGWTRAETDIGRAYYRRFGGSVQFNYRPVGF
ncbi:MAG: hypothetical protein RJQ04_04865 [Longimicrobiales bacterium]